LCVSLEKGPAHHTRALQSGLGRLLIRRFQLGEQTLEPCWCSLSIWRRCRRTLLAAVLAARRRAFTKRLVDLVLEALERR
jgi:hypothetical protein